MKSIIIILLASLFTCSGNEGNMRLFKTPLEKAILLWQKDGGDLNDILGDLSNKKIKSRNEAKVIVNALKQYSMTGNKSNDTIIFSPLHTLIAFLQQVESRTAYEEFKNNGVPELIRLFHEGKNKKNCESDLMFSLKILAMYEDEKATETILDAARDSFAVDGYLWSIIFGQFGEKHVHKQKAIEVFRNKLPDGFISVAYLDFVNVVAINDRMEKHPFDSEDGINKLTKWLNDTNLDNSSYAHSSAAAIPFIKNEKDRKRLLDLALNYPEMGVKMEAAWAAAKTGEHKGIQFLKEKACEVNYSRTACEYLKQLNLENEIPAITQDEDFQAMAEMCSWLSHPNEFGRPPNKIEQYDKREIFWPPTNDKRNVWLFKYTFNPTDENEEIEIGISMVGSVTFALFGEATENLRPEEVYGIHCCWELEGNEDRRAPENRSAEAGISILSKYNEGFK